MGRHPKERLRALTLEEQNDLENISRARSAPSEAVIRAKILLAVAEGMTRTQAAHSVGRRSNDAVSTLVKRFNEEGLEALIPRYGGGFSTCYGASEKVRILQEFKRTPISKWMGHQLGHWSLYNGHCVLPRMVCHR